MFAFRITGKRPPDMVRQFGETFDHVVFAQYDSPSSAEIALRRWFESEANWRNSVQTVESIQRLGRVINGPHLKWVDWLTIPIRGEPTPMGNCG